MSASKRSLAAQRAVATKGEPTIVEVIADGLDAVADGRGFGGEHLEAVKLANASRRLLAGCQAALKATAFDEGNYREICAAAIAEATGGVR